MLQVEVAFSKGCQSQSQSQGYIQSLLTKTNSKSVIWGQYNYPVFLQVLYENTLTVPHHAQDSAFENSLHFKIISN